MMPAPTTDTAKTEMGNAESGIDFNSPTWHALEIWAGWRRYDLALKMLTEKDDQERAKLHGMATMCKELTMMGAAKRG